MITKKEAKAISVLFNSVIVSRMMVEDNLQKKDSAEVTHWMKMHDHDADHLINNFGITISKYNVRTY
jgi:hypothetical protein